MVERFGRNAQLERIGRELRRRENNTRTWLDSGRRLSEELNCRLCGNEYVPYSNLANVLHLVPRDRIWPIVSQVASAARFLESLELAHRDIKPDNIAVSDDFQPRSC